MNVEKFEILFGGKDIDISDVERARRFILDQVNDPSFETLVGNLRVMANNAAGGPAPRGGECGVRAGTDGHGNTHADIGCSIRW